MIWNRTLQKLFEYLKLDEKQYSVLDIYQLEGIIAELTKQVEDDAEAAWQDRYSLSKLDQKKAYDEGKEDGRQEGIEEAFREITEDVLCEKESIESKSTPTEEDGKALASIQTLLEYLEQKEHDMY